jgi:hypothetical protein
MISFTLTNGGKGVITAAQIEAGAKSSNGFWVDLYGPRTLTSSFSSPSSGSSGDGSSGGGGGEGDHLGERPSRGSVRVTCSKENLSHLSRRLSAVDDLLLGGEAGALGEGKPGQLMLRKLNGLRKIPKVGVRESVFL